jgi:hypothetical protein
MAILIAGHICLVFISPPGELTIMVYFMMVVGKLCLATNFYDMKECDALESNKIIAGCEFARNIPNTTSWDCVIPRSEKEGMKPPYVCPGCSNHTYSNNMITRFHVQ